MVKTLAHRNIDDAVTSRRKAFLISTLPSSAPLRETRCAMEREGEGALRDGA
jgi:hypothetical protein